MRKILLTMGGGFLLATAGAQQPATRSQAKIEAGPGGTGFGYEAKLASRFTIDVNTGIGGN
ncbi:hypothetical protein, partial [Niabella drilacis]